MCDINGVMVQYNSLVNVKRRYFPVLGSKVYSTV